MCSVEVASSLTTIGAADHSVAGFVSVFAADVVLSAVVTDAVGSVRVSVIAADAVSSEVEGVVVPWVFVFAVVCMVVYN